MKISKRAMEMKPSATLAIAALAGEMRAKGIDVISFATGEPDFDTPEHIRSEAKRALDAGKTRYEASSGSADLKKAISEKLRRDNGLDYADDEIVVTCGAKQAIFNALQVLTEEGDEVLVPSPYWVSYPDQIKLAGATPVIVPAALEPNLKVSPRLLERFATAKTRAIILNSPSNPSGAAYESAELRDIANFCADRNIAVISDEIYEKLVYDGFKFTSLAASSPNAKATTVTINGVSKAYAMTGWRMGYAAGPKEVISKITSMVGQQISCIPGFVQKACIDALNNSDADVERMRSEFSSRRDLMLERLLRIPNIKCSIPKGAFYLLPDMRAYLGDKTKMENATSLAKYLLETAHIATVSGDPFGAEGHIRFSYATSREKINEGMMRLEKALAKLA